MTKHTTTKLVPDVIEYGRFSSNGQVPQAGALGRMARALNHVAKYHPKMWTCLSDDLLDPVGGAGGLRQMGKFHGRTGPTTEAIRCYVGLSQGDSDTATDPRMDIRLLNVDGTIHATSDEIHYSESFASPADSPDGIMHSHIDIEVEPDSEYFGRIRAFDYARPIRLTVMEVPRGYKVDDTDDGTVNPAPFIVENDIEDDDIQDLLEAATTLWRKGANQLLAWSTLNEGDFPQTTGASWTNLHSDAVLRLELDQLRTAGNPMIPVVFGTYTVDTGAGVTGTVRLRNTTTGETLIEIVSAGSTDYHRVAGEISAENSGDDLEIQYRSDGSATVRIEMVSLFQYDFDRTPPIQNSLVLEASSSQDAGITDAAQSGLDIAPNITLECWAKFASLPSNGNSMALLGKWEIGDRSYLLRVHNDGGTYKVRMAISANGSDRHSVEATWSGAATDTWAHFAGSFQGSPSGTITDQFQILIDGAEQTVSSLEDNGANTIHNSDAEFRVGSAAGAIYFDGQICDVRVWSAVRTAAQIDYWKDKPILLDENDLAGAWHRTDDHKDLTSRGNDLTASNSPTFSSDTPQ